jgi:hypothetical protein
MGELVNLRQVKKRRARDADAASAEANRLLHGRTKAEKLAEVQARALAKKRLDQLKLDVSD